MANLSGNNSNDNVSKQTSPSTLQQNPNTKKHTNTTSSNKQSLSTNVTNIQLYPMKMNENLGAAIVASVNFIDSRSSKISSNNKAKHHNNSSHLESSSLNFDPNNQTSSRSNNSGSNLAPNTIVNTSFNHNSQHPFNLLNQQASLNRALNNNMHNNNNNASTNRTVNNQNNTSSHHIWHDESNSGWTGTGVMSDRSSVYSIDDGVGFF